MTGTRTWFGTGFTDEGLDLARELRAAGACWAEAERRTGITAYTLRMKLDEGFATKDRMKGRTLAKAVRRMQPLLPHYAEHGPSQADLRRLLDTVPADTRSRTARLMGDPLTGRSALDRRGGHP